MVNPTIVQMKGHSLRKKLSEIVPKLIEGQEKLEEGYNLMYSLEEKVSAIDEEVQTAHREGKHAILTEMPIVFDIENMSNKDAQRAVWSSILELLVKRHYRVWISHGASFCKIKVTWISTEDELVIKAQNKRSFFLTSCINVS